MATIASLVGLDIHPVVDTEQLRGGFSVARLRWLILVIAVDVEGRPPLSTQLVHYQWQNGRLAACGSEFGLSRSCFGHLFGRAET